MATGCNQPHAEGSESVSDHDAEKGKKLRDVAQAGIALSADETVRRYGSASAEFIKGYRGVDNETGLRFAAGLRDISGHKLNADPIEAAKNLKQQAGYSAEVAATSHDNAKAIISGSNARTVRTDDLPEYGKNHTKVDRVQILDGKVCINSEAQMKFVGNRNQLFQRITQEDGKFARYRGIKIELPSEQFEGAQTFCLEKAEALRQQAVKVQAAGKEDVAAKLLKEAENYEELAGNVADSGLTTDDALFYRKHPEIATALDIFRTSHQAGVESATYGAVIGSCISALQNMVQLAQGEKDLAQAAIDVAKDTGKAAALGYGTGFMGSAIKGAMQQAGNGTMRTLSNTSAPTLVLNACLALSCAIKRYASGEISESQLLVEVGERGSGMLSAGMMSALGQIAIPIPFVGAAIGGMIGCTLSSLFYQSALDAARGAELSREQLARVQAIQAAARVRIAEEQTELDSFIAREMPALQAASRDLRMLLNATDAGPNDLAMAVNRFANKLGKHLEFNSQAEFDDFMLSDRPLSL